jgi:hypothetical protein
MRSDIHRIRSGTEASRTCRPVTFARTTASDASGGVADAALAARVEREHYREHLRAMVATLSRVAGEAAHDAAAADVDGMSYEELQQLGDTIGKVQVRRQCTVVLASQTVGRPTLTGPIALGPRAPWCWC